MSHNGALNFYEGDSASVFVKTTLAGTVAATAVHMLDLDGGMKKCSVHMLDLDGGGCMRERSVHMLDLEGGG
jgi:hypothetical protein